MCGIFGVLFPTRSFLAEVESMGQVLAHRGPDDSGLESTPTAILGHRRLSIIDLSAAAHQPMWDAYRQACIVFNGEIYNYRELRRECRQAGFDFHSSSDTEVILNLYLLHGEAAFDRLNGIFAFCLHDARSGEYLLVRDPMGVKPLYYAETAHGIFFASELKALSRTGVVRSEVDPAALQAYLQLDYVPAPMSILRGVHKLREGHLMQVHGLHGARVRCYSSLAWAEPKQQRRRTFDDDLGELDRLLRHAVKAQLVADVPVGMFLSGGIDSSVIAAVAAEVSEEPIKTFSIAFEDPSFDESEYFSAVAAAIGSEHRVRLLRPADMLELLPDMAHVMCEPLADGSVFPTYLLSRFVREHVTVALSGDGADELFAGYPTYLAAVLARPLGWLPQPVVRGLTAAAHATLPVSLRNFSFDFKVKKLLAGLQGDAILQNARWLGSFLPHELPQLLEQYEPRHQPVLEEMLHEPTRAAGAVACLERLLRTDQRFYLQDQVLVKVDRMSMAHALEVRVPYLDPSVVAFARSLPPRRKLSLGRGKLLLKRYGSQWLPDAVLRRPKKGFGTPLGRWFRQELKELVADELGNSRLRRAGFFRPQYVARLLEEHWSGRRDHRKLIFNLLAFSMWHETLADRVTAGPTRGGQRMQSRLCPPVC